MCYAYDMSFVLKYFAIQQLFYTDKLFQMKLNNIMLTNNFKMLKRISLIKLHWQYERIYSIDL